MKPGHHVCVAYNEGRGTIRVRRTEDRPNDRQVLLYPETSISTFDGHPAGWPVPAVTFWLRAHEVDAFKQAFRAR